MLTVFYFHYIKNVAITIKILAVWLGYSWGTVILALNRLLFPTQYGHYFDGKNVNFWLCVPPVLTFLSMYFHRPAIFITQFGGYLFNPFAGIIEESTDYVSFFVLVQQNFKKLTC